jgi:hypothetical protein
MTSFTGVVFDLELGEGEWVDVTATYSTTPEQSTVANIAVTNTEATSGLQWNAGTTRVWGGSNAAASKTTVRVVVNAQNALPHVPVAVQFARGSVQFGTRYLKAVTHSTGIPKEASTTMNLGRVGQSAGKFWTWGSLLMFGVAVLLVVTAVWTMVVWATRLNNRRPLFYRGSKMWERLESETPAGVRVIVGGGSFVLSALTAAFICFNGFETQPAVNLWRDMTDSNKSVFTVNGKAVDPFLLQTHKNYMVKPNIQCNKNTVSGVKSTYQTCVPGVLSSTGQINGEGAWANSATPAPTNAGAFGALASPGVGKIATAPVVA